MIRALAPASGLELRREELRVNSLEPRKLSDYSPEKIERIKAAQKRHAAFDPGCEKLTLEEFINWHPVGGPERARRMEEQAQAMQNQEVPVLVNN